MNDISNKHNVVSRSWLARWPQWSGYVAAIWSLCYGMLGFYWMLGGVGFPFGSENDRAAVYESFLAGVRTASGAPVIVVLGLIGALIALTMARGWGRGMARTVLLAMASLIAVVLLIVIPDRRVLMAVAYAPLFLVGAPFNWPPVSFLVAIPWPVINQAILMAGGLFWAATAVSYQRRTRGAGENYGRTVGYGEWWNREKVARWAVGVAVVVPCIYASTRIAWALGIPLGISEQFLREGQASGLWLAGLGLAFVAIGGAILTLGLVQRWGEIFPRWMLGLAGKRVPPMLAIIPASFVSFIVTSAGLSYIRSVIIDGSLAENWTTKGPELLWPIWGLALATATYVYYHRRRDAANIVERNNSRTICS